MSSVANVTIHQSQFPENVRRDLIQSLRTRKVNHKFHYDSIKQTQKWLMLHQAYSPSRTDPDCAAIYDRGFKAVANRIVAERAHLIGLGCGGGQKDTRLLRMHRKKGCKMSYTPSDVSTAMVLVARKSATEVVRDENCFPLVCDLATAEDLPQVIEMSAAPDAARIITFFGMIPNFEPDMILPRLSGLLRSKDWLLFSANLAPGNNYNVGMRKILPLYDNALTRDWLMTFLRDLGTDADDGEIDFRIEDVPMRGAVTIANPVNRRAQPGRKVPSVPPQVLKRVAAYFQFRRNKEISLEGERFQFGPEKPIRLFFSYRHTPELVRSLLGNFGIEVMEQWITRSQEEGVFLCKRR